MDPLLFFFVLLRASMLSIGGQTAIPLLRADLVSTGVITDAGLIQALTVGRIGTGPGGLYIVAIGYLAMGVTGAVLALAATVIPPLIVLPMSDFLRPRMQQPRVDGFMRGMTLTTSGLVVATSVDLALTGTPGGTQPWQYGLIVAAALAGYTRRLHPILVIGAAALIGILVWLTGPSLIGG